MTASSINLITRLVSKHYSNAPNAFIPPELVLHLSS